MKIEIVINSVIITVEVTDDEYKKIRDVQDMYFRTVSAEIRPAKRKVDE